MKTFVLMMVSLLFAISSEAQNKSFYDFTVKTIDGKDFPLSSLKGKKVLVVNVASKCGLTPQYAQLEKLYEKYKEKNFVVIGFPANNFMGQEPGLGERGRRYDTDSVRHRGKDGKAERRRRQLYSAQAGNISRGRTV